MFSVSFPCRAQTFIDNALLGLGADRRLLTAHLSTPWPVLDEFVSNDLIGILLSLLSYGISDMSNRL